MKTIILTLILFVTTAASAETILTKDSRVNTNPNCPGQIELSKHTSDLDLSESLAAAFYPPSSFQLVEYISGTDDISLMTAGESDSRLLSDYSGKFVSQKLLVQSSAARSTGYPLFVLMYIKKYEGGYVYVTSNILNNEEYDSVSKAYCLSTVGYKIK